MPWRDVRFGIELEMTPPGGIDAPESLLQIIPKELELDSPWFSEDGEHDGYRSWSLGYDGGGWEIRTPICTTSAWPNIVSVLEYLRTLGCSTDAQSGTHIHLDLVADGWDRTLLSFFAWAEYEQLFLALVEPSRRANHYCSAMRSEINWPTALRAVDEVNIPGCRRICRTVTRRAYGLSQSENTVEVRLHHGSLDPTDIWSWTTFLRAFLGTSTRGLTQSPLALRDSEATNRAQLDRLLAETKGLFTPTEYSIISDNFNERLARYAS